MRPFEILIFCFSLLMLLFSFFPKLSKFSIAALIGAMLGVFLHLLFEKTRWQMIPVFIFLGASLVIILVKRFRQKKTSLKSSSRWLSIVGGVLLLLFFLPPILFPVPSLPDPDGPYSIGTTSFYWVDETRVETLSPTPAGERRIMVQVWYPAEETPGVGLAPYMDQLDVMGPVLAKQFGLPGFLFNHIKLAKTHAYVDVPVSGSEANYPVLIFSHGWTGVRTQNTYQAEYLASHGYIVIAPDHTYGAGIVVFPDGSSVLNNPALLPEDAQSEAEYDRRVRPLGEAWVNDLRFTLDQAELLNDGSIPSDFKGKLDLTRVGFFGHSTGGGAVIETCFLDERCVVGLTEDAWMVPFSREVPEEGLQQPFLFMQSESWSAARNTALFNTLYDNTHALEFKLVINGTKHYDFSDIPLLTPLAPMIGLKGPINGERGLFIINTYSLNFFDQYLKSIPSSLLQSQSPDFPEVIFSRNNSD